MPAAARERLFGVVADNDGLIVGIQEVNVNGRKEWGITCAFCHSTVDRGGNRLNGVPNARLNAGAILALSCATAPWIGERSGIEGVSP